jgi:hypothetical protein
MKQNRINSYTKVTKLWWEIEPERRFYAKSKWEYNYACFLEWSIKAELILDWKYEPDTFWFEGIKRGINNYTPDFKVTETSGAVYWVEVKGWMDDKSKTKIKRMAKYHPNVRLVLVQKKQMDSIKKIASMLPGWIP